MAMCDVGTEKTGKALSAKALARIRRSSKVSWQLLAIGNSFFSSVFCSLCCFEGIFVEATRSVKDARMIQRCLDVFDLCSSLGALPVS